jgi:hypothetical protein
MVRREGRLLGQTYHNVICLQAEKLEESLAERSREVHNLRLELQDRHHKQRKMRAGLHWVSEEGISVSMGSLAVSAFTQLMRLKYLLLYRLLRKSFCCFNKVCKGQAPVPMAARS